MPVPTTSSAADSVAVDGQGNVYFIDRLFTLVKLNATGQQVWQRTVTTPLSAVFVLGTGADQKVGAVMRDQAGAKMWALGGAALCNSDVRGDGSDG